MISPSVLSEATKKRGLITLLVDTFLMWAGFFMVVPLLSIHYVENLGWAAASIGLVLAIRQVLQQGLTPISGMLADRIGAKGLICAGLLLRMVGFGLMAWSTTFALLVFSTVLAGLGGSMFDSPRSASVAALTDESNRARYYSLTGVFSGLGLTLGTQIGALLINADFAYVALGAAACFFLTFLVTFIFLPPVRVASEGGTLLSGFKMALYDRPFVTFNLLLLGFWFMWVQQSISLPLAAKSVGGGPDTVGMIYGISAAMSILVQYPLLRLASRFLKPLPILFIGVAVMSLGMGSIALAGSVPALLACVVLYSAGSLLASPSQQTVTANLSNPARLGSYFGVNSLSLALGGGIGNLSGGILYDVGRGSAFPALPWLVFCIVGLSSATGLVVMWVRQRQRQRQEAREDSAEAVAA